MRTDTRAQDGSGHAFQPRTFDIVQLHADTKRRELEAAFQVVRRLDKDDRKALALALRDHLASKPRPERHLAKRVTLYHTALRRTCG